MKQTIKGNLISRLDIVLKKDNKHKDFLTWDDIPCIAFGNFRNYLSYEGRIAVDYLKKQGYKMKLYSDVYSDHKLHGNTRIFIKK